MISLRDSCFTEKANTTNDLQPEVLPHFGALVQVPNVFQQAVAEPNIGARASMATARNSGLDESANRTSGCDTMNRSNNEGGQATGSGNQSGSGSGEND